MPKKLEKLLRKQANKKGLSGRDLTRYVYGALRKTGWKPRKRGSKKVAKI